MAVRHKGRVFDVIVQENFIERLKGLAGLGRIHLKQDQRPAIVGKTTTAVWVQLVE